MRYFLISLCFIFFAGLAGAEIRSSDDKKPSVSFLSEDEIAKHQETIDRVQQYLSGLTTVVSEFMQTAPDGSLTNGKFYLQRPGKMRWQYNPPTPILMVANGSELVYYDYDLDQVSHLPLDDTLISFLTLSPISLSNKMVGITEFSEDAGAIRVSIVLRDKPGDGQLTLEFSDHPLLIRNMIVRDATNQVTTVSLNNARFGVKLSPELFVFRERDMKRRKINQ